MFEVEIRKYVKEGHKKLPCKAAQNAFDSYIEMVIHDIAENNPNCTFEEVLEQLGESPKSTAEEFLESQPTELVGQWKKQGKKKKYCKIVWYISIVVVLIAIIAGLVRTNGVLIINTETTVAEIPDSSDLAGLSLEEQAKIICEAGIPDTERK